MKPSLRQLRFRLCQFSKPRHGKWWGAAALPIAIEIAWTAYAVAQPVPPWTLLDSPSTDQPICVADELNANINPGAFIVAANININDVNKGNVVCHILNPDGATLALPDPGWKLVFDHAIPPVFSTPVACAHANGEFYLFGRRTDGSILTTKTVNQPLGGWKWEDWSLLPGGATTDRPLAATSDGIDVFLFRKDPIDKRLYQNVLPQGGAWSGWSPVDPQFTTDNGPSATMARTQNDHRVLYLFAVKAGDMQIYVNSRDLDKTTVWSGWRPVPGAMTVEEPVGAASEGDHIWLVARAVGGAVKSNRFTLMTTTDLVVGIREEDHWRGWSVLPGNGETQATPFVERNTVFIVNGGRVFVQQLR